MSNYVCEVSRRFWHSNKGSIHIFGRNCPRSHPNIAFLNEIGYEAVFLLCFFAIAKRVSEIWLPEVVGCRDECSVSLPLGGSGVLPRENFEKIDLKWCAVDHFKNTETNFVDWLKVASCQKKFASCQAILPVAKCGNWQPKKKHCEGALTFQCISLEPLWQ